MPVIGMAVGVMLFVAAFFSFDSTIFFSRLPNNEFGFCAVGAIVVVGVYSIGALSVFALAKKQSARAEKGVDKLITSSAT